MKTRVYTIFVASPSDLKPEREALEEVIKELSDTWTTTIGVSLHLIRWETHAYPGFGEDPQAVINDEITSDYDIFIGILWARFGSPTHRSESGTSEEFERAYDRYKKDPNNIRLMLYFKEQPISPSKIDTEQLEKVKDFRERVINLGGLHWTFEDLSEFTKLIRMHLSKYILPKIATSPISRTIIQDNIVEQPKAQSDIRQQKRSDLTLDVGFIDLIEEGTENFKKLHDTTQRIVQILNEYTARILQRTAELNTIGAPTDQQTLAKVKNIINSAANEMDEFSSQLDNEAKVFHNAYSIGIDTYGKAAALSTDFGKESQKEVAEALAIVRIVKSSLSSVKESINELRNKIAILPRVTTNFNKSKRRCLQVLDSFITNIESGLSLTGEVEELISGLLS